MKIPFRIIFLREYFSIKLDEIVWLIGPSNPAIELSIEIVEFDAFIAIAKGAMYWSPKELFIVANKPSLIEVFLALLFSSSSFFIIIFFYF